MPNCREDLAPEEARSPEDLMARDLVAEAPRTAPVMAWPASNAFFLAALSPLSVPEGSSVAKSSESLSASTLDGGWVGADSSEVSSGRPASEVILETEVRRFLGICLSHSM